jgi:hypothetical protein
MSYQINYKASPTAEEFHNSDGFVRGIRGPIGSGKSVAMCFEIFIRACQQEPNHEGIRKSRALIVRNTLPQLETTTMKTWKDWFPAGDTKKGYFGPMTGKPPYTHYVKYTLPDKTLVDLEVQFIALDKPEDVKKLLSYECSGVWFNEAREIEKELVDAATGRVGRYPTTKDGGCTRKYIIMDTNPPDDSHWWYHLAEEDTPKKWAFFNQPSGLHKDAENLEHLNQPKNWKDLTIEQRREVGRGYYEDMIGGKTEEWINVYVHGQYGFIKEGQPVYGTAWNPDLHVAKEEIKVNPTGILTVGIDCSGRHPAAIFLQESSRGQVQVIHELCVMEDEGMGAPNFSALLKRECNKLFPQNILQFFGDPAGGFRSQNSEQTFFDILRANDIPVKPAPVVGNRIEPRVQSVMYQLGKMIDGTPAFVVSSNCKILIRGFNGGYQYRRLSTSGETRYDDKPFKNRFADPHDALQYGILGLGGYSKMLGRHRTKRQTVQPVQTWKVFD